MPSPPLLVDQVSIGSTNTESLLISKQVGGKMLFTDNDILLGILLKKLSGLSLDNTVLVGAGSGADFTNISDALAAAPTTASSLNPYMILVFPGTYLENLIIDKDGIILQALGKVSVISQADLDTLSITMGVSTTPLYCYVSGVSFNNSWDNRACLSIIGDANTTLGGNLIEIKNCNFEATGLGTYCVQASTMNNLKISGCTALGSVTSSSFYVEQCASIEISDFRESEVGLTLLYNSTLDIPSIATSSYALKSCQYYTLVSSLIGVGSLSLLDTDILTSVALSGDRSVACSRCSLEQLQINDTTSVTSRNSYLGTIAGSPTASLEMDKFVGQTTIVASTTVVVPLEVPTIDNQFIVTISHSFPGVTYSIVNTSVDFTITFSSAQTGAIDYMINR